MDISGAKGESGLEPAPAETLIQILELARRRLALVIGCAVLCTALAGTVVTLQAPVYRATAELLVSPQALQVVGRDIVRSDSSASLDFANVDSQSLVMLSTPVLREVADELDLAADPAFQPRPGLLSRLTGARTEPGAAEKRDAVIEILRQSIVIHRVENALVFQITVSNPSASRAAAIANALARAYLRVTAQERVEAVKRADGSIIAQVSGLREQLDAADAAVERFRSANNLVRSSPDGLVVTQQLKDLYTQIDAAGAEVSRLAARKEQVAKIGPEALLADAVPESLASPTLTTLRSQYAALAREAASQAPTLLPQHPHMVELRAELAEAQRQLRSELARIRVSASNAYAQAASNLSKLQARAQDLTRTKNDSSEAETKLRQLESEAQAIRAVFDASLGRARELEQQGKIETGSSRVLSDAMPPARPSRAPLPIVLAAAALFGACFGLGLGFLLDRWPRRAGGDGLTARDAGRLLGVGAAVTLPSARGFRGDAARFRTLEAALEPTASQLSTALRAQLPALVAVVAIRGASGLQALAEPLAQALAELGEDVLLCEAGHPRDGMAVRPVESRGGGRTPRAPAGPPGEFVVAAVDLERALAQDLDAARSAHAVILVVDLGRTSPAALLAAARAVDPARRRIAALLAVDSSAERRFGPIRARAVEAAA